MAIALITLTWCDRHLADKDEEVPAEPMPVLDGYGLDLCSECAAPILEVLAAYEKYGSKGDRTPRPPRKIKRPTPAKAVAAASAPMSDSHVCPECEGSYASRQSLASHTRNVHDKSLAELEGRPTPYHCSCGKNFAAPPGLALHVKKHPGHQQAAAS